MAGARHAALALALVAAALVAAALAACRTPAPARPIWPDAPAQLRDDDHRAAAIDRLWVLPPGAARDGERAAIAAAIARRIDDAIDDERPFAAAELLEELAALWQDDAPALGTGLAPHTELLRRLRAMFARAGALEAAVRVLVVLAEVEPGGRAAHTAELDEILEFADGLAVAEHGPDGSRAQPIALLQPTAVLLPLPWLVDRYVGLVVERQVTVAGVLAARGASLALVRAQTDILSASRRIAIVLARAGRIAEIHRALLRLRPGIGAAAEGRDRELRIAAERVAEHPTAEAFAALASRLRSDEHAPSPAAALAVALAGLGRHPGDPALRAAAAGDARALGRIDQAIALYEGAARGTREVDAALALRLGRLYGDRIARLASIGQPAAAQRAWRAALQFTDDIARTHQHTVWRQTAAIAESALGKGLASQGLIEDGRHALTESLERAPSIEALETLTVIDLQIDRTASALRWAGAGMELLGEETSGDRYHRARLTRHTADAHRRAGRSREAAAGYLDTLRAWSALGELRDLPRAIAAERLLESGRATWWLGEANRAVEYMLTAGEIDPVSPEIATGTVAFLIGVGRYRDALDAYHRVLGEPGMPQRYKIYTSLWILGEASRLGEPRDRLAHEYLASRRGDLWPELLARAATGRLPYEELSMAAVTGPQRGELAFYGAVLGLDPAARAPEGRRALLQLTVDARAVLDVEYDLARANLARPQLPATPAPPAQPSATPATAQPRHVAPAHR
ncbi:MAG TPA: hypothetical protein VNO30_17825 [Kofleriaceae bacterium]|nr:hypothetical protein [Kofleriaceae bacterium]